MCLLWWRRHLLVRMQERWYDCSVRLCPDHAGIWISDRLVPAHWRRITANRWSAVAVGDTSTRIYLGSVNINLIGVGHRLVPFHYRILESRFSAMLFCERGYPRNGKLSLTMQCLLLFIIQEFVPDVYITHIMTHHTTGARLVTSEVSTCSPCIQVEFLILYLAPDLSSQSCRCCGSCDWLRVHSSGSNGSPAVLYCTVLYCTV